MEKKDKKQIQMEYDQLKEHRICLEEMVAEQEFKAKEMIEKANINEDKPVTVRNCLTAAEHATRRAESLRTALELADAELWHLMKLLE